MTDMALLVGSLSAIGLFDEAASSPVPIHGREAYATSKTQAGRL